MAKIINVDRLDSLESFEPGGHKGTLNHKLVHAGNGAQKLAIWHGRVEPGGEAEPHQHADMEQVFYVLQGQARITLDDEDHLLGLGDMILVPMGVTHQICSVGSRALRLLITMAPSPDSDDLWGAEDH